MKRLLPSPLLSAALFALWLLLNQSLGAGTLLMAAVLAVAGPLLTAGLRPTPVHIRRPTVALRLAGVVLGDVLRSGLEVGRLVLSRRSRDIPSGFARVPLELRDPNGLAVLAMILSMTPGTAWAEVAMDRTVLLLHVFDLPDEAALVAHVKQRYERPLMEIFE
jgi:multicomponent K+:H+ antiporter subunit E